MVARSRFRAIAWNLGVELWRGSRQTDTIRWRHDRAGPLCHAFFPLDRAPHRVRGIAGIRRRCRALRLLMPRSARLHASSDRRRVFQTARILDRNGALLGEFNDPQGGRRTVVPLAKIPQSLRDATIAAEDANFYEHPGLRRLRDPPRLLPERPRSRDRQRRQHHHPAARQEHAARPPSRRRIARSRRRSWPGRSAAATRRTASWSCT